MMEWEVEQQINVPSFKAFAAMEVVIWGELSIERYILLRWGGGWVEHEIRTQGDKEIVISPGTMSL